MKTKVTITIEGKGEIMNTAGSTVIGHLTGEFINELKEKHDVDAVSALYESLMSELRKLV